MLPSDIQAAVQSSRQHLSAGAPDAAIQQLQEVLDHEPNNLACLKLLGVACAMKGDNARAAANLEAALALDGSDAQSQYNLALLYEKQDRFPEALVCVEAALRLKPDYPLARQAWGRVQPRAQEILDRAARDADERLRREASERAAQLPVGDPEPLVDAALHHEDPRVRRCGVRVISQLPRPRALACYSAALTDEDELVRRSAAKALARDVGADAVPILLQALKDSEFSVRNSAVRGLVALKKIDASAAAEAISALHALVTGEDADVRSAAVQALVRLGDAEALSSLRQLLQAGHITVEDAGKLLAECDDPRIAEQIADWHEDPHDAVRETAASVREQRERTAGGGSSDDAASDMEALAEQLKSATLVGERERAARALGKSESPEAVAPLVAALQDRAFSVRMESARSLAAIGDRSAIDAILPMLSDSYLGARPVAVEALSALGWRPALLTDWVASTFTDLNEGEKRALLKEFAVRALAHRPADTGSAE